MENQYPPCLAQILQERRAIFRTENAITNRNTLPSDGIYPLANNQWLKIPNVVCLFVDMRNSTGLSATHHDKGTASIYEYFTGTAIRIFHELGAEYIDVKGDGVFALFNENQVHRAFVAAVSFKSFAGGQFLTDVERKLINGAVDIGYHMGIDQKTVLVKRLGLRDVEGRDSRQNEVWAGKPINMAAKLASRSVDGELLVSDRYYNNLANSDYVKKTCGCVLGNPDQTAVTDVWKERDMSTETIFDFDKAYSMKNFWCVTHGANWAENILSLD